MYSTVYHVNCLVSLDSYISDDYSPSCSDLSDQEDLPLSPDYEIQDFMDSDLSDSTSNDQRNIEHGLEIDGDEDDEILDSGRNDFIFSPKCYNVETAV